MEEKSQNIIDKEYYLNTGYAFFYNLHCGPTTNKCKIFKNLF